MSQLPSPAVLDFSFLFFGSMIAGFIDAIAGGGGLITLPLLTLLVGQGPHAIGTNKIGGLAAAAAALFVYSRKGHFNLEKSLAFALWVGVGSMLGSQLSPLIPTVYFKWFLLFTCPLILWIVWKKDFWISHKSEGAPLGLQALNESVSSRSSRIMIAGILCGIYDGMWGPGGGTFMLLSLLFLAKIPLFTALAASKLSNSMSAFVALCSYASNGYVHWLIGLIGGSGLMLGAFLGAHFATRKATSIVRPVLAAVASLLALKIFVS